MNKYHFSSLCLMKWLKEILFSWDLIVSNAIQNGEFDMGLKMYLYITRKLVNAIKISS